MTTSDFDRLRSRVGCRAIDNDRQKNTQGEELILALHARAGVLDDLPERMAQAMRDHLRMRIVERAVD